MMSATVTATPIAHLEAWGLCVGMYISQDMGVTDAQYHYYTHLGYILILKAGDFVLGCISQDMGVTDAQYHYYTHLGYILKAGDFVLGCISPNI